MVVTKRCPIYQETILAVTQTRGRIHPVSPVLDLAVLDLAVLDAKG